MPRLYDVEWYNGRPFEYEEGFLSNRAAFLVGMPRMRQLRVKPGVYSAVFKGLSKVITRLRLLLLVIS